MTVPPQPNQPPVPDGYGHLPGPPQQGYGRPHAGPNPYAQQPPHAGAPHPGHGYGYPQPPTVPQPYPVPGGPGGPGKPPRGKRTALVAAAVAAALALGTGGYFVLAGDDNDGAGGKPAAQGSAPADAGPSAGPSVDKGDGKGDGKGGGTEPDLNSGRKPGEDRVLWLKTNSVELPGGGAPAPAQWVVGDTVVKLAYKTVTGYAVTDGKERWSVTLPGTLCGATPNQASPDGKTVLAYKSGDSGESDCNQLKMIDLKAGKEGWTKEVPKEGIFDIMTSLTLAISGDTVAVSRVGSSSAFKVSTGDRLFARTEQPTTDPGGCKPETYAGGSKLVAVARCPDAGEELQGADPVTGRTTWHYRLPTGWRVSKIYSVDPVVIDATNKEKNERSIAVVGTDGKLRTQLSGDGKFAARCGLTLMDRSLQNCTGVVVDAATNTMYLPTEGRSNEIVAFDLGTGKSTWRTPAGPNREVIPLKVENGQLYGYLAGDDDKGGEVLSVPLGGGKATTVLRNPSAPAAKVENTMLSPQIDFVDGRLFLSSTHLAGSRDGSPEKLLMVFGK
ncbi:PQQ-binding-like beta-propeller repeat protein [Streptomyces sp. NPDC090022]|uniref:outer membrane protein assembly factor BamB family protein n=1 Tax=Streptomyces sp. NPDC090022 TaxID=3365920 RepID=UPI00383045A4